MLVGSQTNQLMYIRTKWTMGIPQANNFHDSHALGIELASCVHHAMSSVWTTWIEPAGALRKLSIQSMLAAFQFGRGSAYSYTKMNSVLISMHLLCIRICDIIYELTENQKKKKNPASSCLFAALGLQICDKISVFFSRSDKSGVIKI